MLLTTKCHDERCALVNDNRKIIGHVHDPFLMPILVTTCLNSPFLVVLCGTSDRNS